MPNLRTAVPASTSRRHAALAVTVVFPAVLVLSVVSCSTGRTYRAAPPTPETASLERQTHAKINEYRLSKGRRALEWRDAIADQARGHSQMMARKQVRFGHAGFNKRVARVGRSHSWKSAAENVAINRTAADVVARWVKNRSHRANIEGDFDLTGVGVAAARDGSVYFTQIFVKSK